jgi:hypothetical protein
MSPLLIQLLEWVSIKPRTYAEAMEAWRSSCPRYTPWEDALIDGLIEIVGGDAVALTERGRAALDEATQGTRTG